MSEVSREKNTGIWTTESQVVRSVVNAENKHRAAADILEDKNYVRTFHKNNVKQISVAHFCD
jgi:hypothetical protein